MGAKHAYCIIAHDDKYCLQTLISLLDDIRNDIYLLIDKKSQDEFSKDITADKSGLFIIPPEKRIDISWGGLSQLKAEFLLFKTAISNGEYEYIHLLSGADLPLKSQTEIHEYFDSLPDSSNVVAFSSGEKIEENLVFKTRFYHPFVEKQKYRNDGDIFHKFQDLMAKTIRKIFVKTQQLIRFRRDWNGLILKKGSQWVSLSYDFTRYLAKREEDILKRFKGVICADEIFIQTEIFNSEYRDTIIDPNKEEEPSIRYIDWKRGAPYTWTKTEFQELVNSGSFFARKFSSKKDKEIIDLIASYININSDKED